MAHEEEEFDNIADIRLVSDEWLSMKDGKGRWNPEDVDDVERRNKFFNKKGKLRK